jgi:hypothetical protein
VQRVGLLRPFWVGFNEGVKNRWLLFFLASLAVCILGGALFSAAALVIMYSVYTGNPASLVGLPVILIYTVPLAMAVGPVAAVIATVLFKLLKSSKWRPVKKVSWICVGSATGIVIGGMFPLLIDAWFEGITTWSGLLQFHSTQTSPSPR